MGLYVGMDLHAELIHIGITDENDKRIEHRKVPCDLWQVLNVLGRYERRIVGIAVESTFNWYWLVDGLMDWGYPVRLAHPSAMHPYKGLKHRNDRSDAFFLAHLLRLGILPQGYIYPKEDRPVRDLLRQRLKLIRERASHIHSFQSLIARHTGKSIGSNEVKRLDEWDVNKMLSEKHLVLRGRNNIGIMRFLTERIQFLEKIALEWVEETARFNVLLSTPGIGDVLGLTICLEAGPIDRFPTVGEYSSYCRMVESKYTSVGKRKGKGNSRSGNPYLHWAYIEAAHCFKKQCRKAKAFYHRKKRRTNGACAAVALGNKLTKAHYYMLKNLTKFDVKRMFG